MPVSVLQTADQSNTLYLPELDETYHSRNGALQESLHVFIENGLIPSLQHKHSLNILEVGFGTGLNAILTLREAHQQGISINYSTLETVPLNISLIHQLNYETFLDPALFSQFLQLHGCAWDAPQEISSIFTLHKKEQKLQEFIPTEPIDLIYFDAFAPDKQPELWTEPIFKKLFDGMNSSGMLVTYSAKGEVKRNLRAAGFEVKRIPGPPGKRHMLQASKN